MLLVSTLFRVLLAFAMGVSAQFMDALQKDTPFYSELTTVDARTGITYRVSSSNYQFLVVSSTAQTRTFPLASLTSPTINQAEFDSNGILFVALTNTVWTSPNMLIRVDMSNTSSSVVSAAVMGSVKSISFGKILANDVVLVTTTSQTNIVQVFSTGDMVSRFNRTIGKSFGTSFCTFGVENELIVYAQSSGQLQKLVWNAGGTLDSAPQIAWTVSFPLFISPTLQGISYDNTTNSVFLTGYLLRRVIVSQVPPAPSNQSTTGPTPTPISITTETTFDRTSAFLACFNASSGNSLWNTTWSGEQAAYAYTSLPVTVSGVSYLYVFGAATSSFDNETYTLSGTQWQGFVSLFRVSQSRAIRLASRFDPFTTLASSFTQGYYCSTNSTIKIRVTSYSASVQSNSMYLTVHLPVDLPVTTTPIPSFLPSPIGHLPVTHGAPTFTLGSTSQDAQPSASSSSAGPSTSLDSGSGAGGMQATATQTVAPTDTPGGNNDVETSAKASNLGSMLSGIIPIIAGVAGIAVLLLLGLCSYCLLVRSGKKGKTSMSHAAGSDRTDFSEYSSYSSIMRAGTEIERSQTGGATDMGSTTMGNATSMTNMQTVVTSDKILVVPGFYEVRHSVDFITGKELTRGGCGAILLGEATSSVLRQRALEKSGQTKIIVKEMLSDGNPENEAVMQMIFDQEVSMMYFFRDNKYFAKVLGYTTQPRMIVMCFYPLGALHNLIHSRDIKWSKFFEICLARDVSLGLKAMHDNGFAHCDMKPGNVLLEKIESAPGIRCLLTDFGIAQVFDSKRILVKAFKTTQVDGGSALYTAPELIRIMRNTAVNPDFSPDMMKARDLYSLGMIMHEMLNRRHLLKSLLAKK